MQNKILIDGREFVKGRSTGIGRVLKGFLEALAKSGIAEEIVLAVDDKNDVPRQLCALKTIGYYQLPSLYWNAEKALTNLSRKFSLFISPYPKLPIFGIHSLSINMVHDILYITHAAYRKNARTIWDRYRFCKALKRASLTWYVSQCSLSETKHHFGFAGGNPIVRINAVDQIFQEKHQQNEDSILKKYALNPGYILILGNGLPHKNLGTLLELSHVITKKFVFVGVSDRNKKYWIKRSSGNKVSWLPYVDELELPTLIRGAFCLAHPSTAEGYGYPPLEAMACGIPPVVSDIPVLRETTGGISLFADPQSPEEWKEAFAALEKPNIYDRIREKGLQWVEPMIGPKGWEKHLDDVRTLLRIGPIVSPETECT